MLQNLLKSKEFTFKNTIHVVLLKCNSSFLYILYQLSRKMDFPVETNRKFQRNLHNILMDKIITQPIVLVLLSDLVVKGKDFKCDRYKPKSNIYQLSRMLIFSMETNRKLKKNYSKLYCTRLTTQPLNLVFLSEFVIDSKV